MDHSCRYPNIAPFTTFGITLFYHQHAYFIQLHHVYFINVIIYYDASLIIFNILVMLNLQLIFIILNACVSQSFTLEIIIYIHYIYCISIITLYLKNVINISHVRYIFDHSQMPWKIQLNLVMFIVFSIIIIYQENVIKFSHVYYIFHHNYILENYN